MNTSTTLTTGLHEHPSTCTTPAPRRVPAIPTLPGNTPIAVHSPHPRNTRSTRMSTSLDDLQAAGAGLGLSVRVHNVALRELASNGELCPDDEHKIDNEAKLAAALHAAWDRDKLNDFTLSVIRLDFAGIIRARHQGLNRT